MPEPADAAGPAFLKAPVNGSSGCSSVKSAQTGSDGASEYLLRSYWFVVEAWCIFPSMKLLVIA